MQVAYPRSQQQKRHWTHLYSAFPFKPYFLLVFHAEVNEGSAVGPGLCCLHADLLQDPGQCNFSLIVQPVVADGVVLGHQVGHLLGKHIAHPFSCKLIPLLLTYLPVSSMSCRYAQKTFSQSLVFSLFTAPLFFYARVLTIRQIALSILFPRLTPIRIFPSLSSSWSDSLPFLIFIPSLTSHWFAVGILK